MISKKINRTHLLAMIGGLGFGLVLGCHRMEDNSTTDGGADDEEVMELTWVTIPGGSFEMGSTDDLTDTDSQPVHTVTVPTFEMLKTEVTVSQYRNCVVAGSCTEPDVSERYNWYHKHGDNYPLNGADWSQAVAFCEWTGGRLPSEAEWEYAARSGGQDIPYPWGHEEPTCERVVLRIGPSAGCHTGSTMEVCQKTAGNTEQGLCDMLGNLEEWIQDWYHGSYDCDRTPNEDNCALGGTAPSDGSAWDDTGDRRVTRGGDFLELAEYLRATARSMALPNSRSIGIGFRCVRDTP